MKPVFGNICKGCGKNVTSDSIHTCSPQYRELSDEELQECREIAIGKADYHHPPSESTYILREWSKVYMQEFARAILKKASEK